MESNRTTTNHSRSLWWALVVLVAAVAVVFSLPRAKPVWVYAVGTGLTMGVMSRYLANVLQVSIGRTNATGVGLCAAVAVWLAVLMAITRQYHVQRPKEDLVRKLFEQLPRNSWEDGTIPAPLTWDSHTTLALRKRYGDSHPRSWGWLWLFVGEGVVAGVIAVAIPSVGRTGNGQRP